MWNLTRKHSLQQQFSFAEIFGKKASSTLIFEGKNGRVFVKA